MSAFVPYMSASVRPPSHSPSLSKPAPRAAVKRRRKPPGYWSDPMTLSTELERFRARYPNRHMPTAAELLAAGRADLCRAVQRHGGFGLAAKRTGLLTTRTRQMRASTHSRDSDWEVRWSVWDKRKIAEPTQTEHHIESGSNKGREASPKKKVLPPEEAAKRRKKRKYERLGPPRRARGYWSVWRNLQTELRAFAKRSCSGYMPLQRELLAANRTDIMNALRFHGGAAIVARRAGLCPAPAAAAKKPRGHWSDPAVLHAELLTFTARYGHPGLMPRRDQLLRAGRADLNYAIRKHGGYSTVAASLHLLWYGPCSYWRVFRNLQKRLLSFVRLRNHGPVMPSFETLRRLGRMDLVYGIALHGGVMMVARRTGLEVVFPELGDDFWGRPENVQRELERALLTQPLEARHSMPSSVTLVQAGRADLATAIRDHGGWIYYAQRLGLRFAYEVRHQGFWAKEENVVQELLNYLTLRYGTWEYPGKPPEHIGPSNKPQKHGGRLPVEGMELPRVKFIPPTELLKRDGRSDIAFAIERYHGGIHAFASRHSLVIAEDVTHIKPAEVLFEWVHFAAELNGWIQKHGSNGIMPSKHDLIRTGRHDLRYATYKHGGALRVSQRLQLVFAQSSVDKWLPPWLGIQASKLGLAIQLSEKKHDLSVTARGLLENLDGQLNGSILGEYKPVMGNSKSGVWTNFKADSRRTRCRGVKKVGATSKSTWNPCERRIRDESPPPQKLSLTELEKLRSRYKHMPPDDIITV